jgi:sporadic carbohydrate cluster protein (TIGR04323 family)
MLISEKQSAVDDKSIIRFDTKEFPFDGIIAECVSSYLKQKFHKDVPCMDLSKLHEFITLEQIGEVSDAIYSLFLADRFIRPYDRLCKQLVSTLYEGRAAYQRVPSVRIQMPGQISVNYHTDEWYGHGHDIQNFWLPLVAVSGTNSMFVTDEIASREVTRVIRDDKKSISQMNELARSVCSPLEMSFGELFHFNSHIIHGTEINTTSKTRISFDFRILRDGDDRGLKDESFFVRSEGRSQLVKTQTSALGAMYIGKQDGFTKLVSQKYQILLCARYAAENGISAQIGETELAGFTHHPVLWNMIRGNHAGSFSHLIVFSALLMPSDPVERSNLVAELKARNLTVHFVVEDVVAVPDRMVDAVEHACQKSRSLN